jgi:hypothetical protein
MFAPSIKQVKTQIALKTKNAEVEAISTKQTH